MATIAVYMNPVLITEYEPQLTNVKVWDYKTPALVAPGNGNAVIIPPGSQDIQVALIPTAGSGKVQLTLDPYEDVIADPDSSNWKDWDSGVVASLTQDSAKGPSAIRQVNVSGSTVMTVIVHR